MHSLNIVRRVVHKCVHALAIVAMVGIGGMMLTISYDVLARFAFAAPTDWAYPLNALGVLSITVLTVPYLYLEGQHIAMDLVHRALPARLRAATDVVTAVATGVFGLVIAITGTRSLVLAIDTGLTGSGTFNIPFWVHDAVLVTSGAFLALVAALFPASPEDSQSEVVRDNGEHADASTKESGGAR